jgi:glycine cleavage system H protein
MVPDDRSYTIDHVWLKESDGGVRVGLTQHGADQLGQVMYVQLPEVGQTIVRDGELAVLEGMKSSMSLFSPLGGTVTAVNEAVRKKPDQINADCYGAGWIVELDVNDDSGERLDAAAYQAYLDR